MNINEIIKYPILSEKTYAQMSSGVYTFAVDKRTNKTEIKQAVQFIFDVKVAQVNVINVDKKPKKIGRFAGFTAGYKKAIVTLADGQINIFPEEVVAPEVKEAKASKKVEDKGVSEAEAKAAAKIAAKIAEKTGSKEENKMTNIKPTSAEAEISKEVKAAEAKIDAKNESQAAKAWDKEEVETEAKVELKEAKLNGGKLPSSKIEAPATKSVAKPAAKVATKDESQAAKAWDKEETK